MNDSGSPSERLGARVESDYWGRKDKVFGVREIELEQLNAFNTASTTCWSLFTGFLFFGLSYIWNLLERSPETQIIWWEQKIVLPILCSFLFAGLAYYFHRTQKNATKAILKNAIKLN